MKKPLIGIIGRPDKEESGPSIIRINDDIRTSIIKNGGIPIGILPSQNIDYANKKYNDIKDMNEEELNSLLESIKLCDGIILQGGTNWYQYDVKIVEYAIKNDIPTLGICLGMQLLGNTDNKTYLEESSSLNKTIINHREPSLNYVHEVEIKKDTLLYDIIKETNIRVNSRHKWHLNYTTNMIVSALSEDGLIEGIEYPGKKFIIGVQWHPENLVNFDNHANIIFERFIKSCRK